MASPSSTARLCKLACRQMPRLSQVNRAQQVAWQHPVTSRRTLTTSLTLRADESTGKNEADGGYRRGLDLKRVDQAFVDSATADGLRHLDQLAKANGFNTLDEYLESTLRYTPSWGSEDRALEDEVRKTNAPEKPNKSSFWYDEDDPEHSTAEHDEFDEDDITSMAHGKLEEVREMRHYARLAVWEMPLLAKLAKPFEPPKDNQVLRWRYTTYMGESHPAEKKVVVQFAPDDLKLTPVQTEKLKKLAGPRYNPETELIKMSSESFEHQAQNKRYLSDLVEDLIKAAKDGKDTFADIPLDLRHHKFKNQPKFPKGWLLTEERRLELDQHRKQEAKLEREKVEQGAVVNGQKLLEESLKLKLLEEQKKERERAAELVAAPARASRQSGGAVRARR